MSTPVNFKAALLTLASAFLAAINLDTSDKAKAAADADAANKTIADLQGQVAAAKAAIPDLTPDEEATVDTALSAALAATPPTPEAVALVTAPVPEADSAPAA